MDATPKENFSPQNVPSPVGTFGPTELNDGGQKEDKDSGASPAEIKSVIRDDRNETMGQVQRVTNPGT